MVIVFILLFMDWFRLLHKQAGNGLRKEENKSPTKLFIFSYWKRERKEEFCGWSHYLIYVIFIFLPTVESIFYIQRQKNTIIYINFHFLFEVFIYIYIFLSFFLFNFGLFLSFFLFIFFFLLTNLKISHFYSFSLISSLSFFSFFFLSQT